MRMSVIPRLIGWRPLGGLAVRAICLAGGTSGLAAGPAVVTLLGDPAPAPLGKTQPLWLRLPSL